MMFIIIAIIGYLVAYRLTSYLAEFKLEKHYSRIDIVFLAVCALIIYLPMLNISDAQKSESENRNLALWKSFISEKGEINYNFGRDYDKWFSDRFNFREPLFQLYVNSFVLSNRYPGFASKIWNKKENTFLYIICSQIVFKTDFEVVKTKLELLKSFLDKRGINLVVQLIPDRELIINDELRYPLLNVPDGQLRKFVSELPDINIHFDVDIYKNEQLKHNLIYHNDHHYNEYGSYIVYKNICKELGIEPVSLDDYEVVKSKNIRDALFLKNKYFNGTLLNGFPVLNKKEALLDREYEYYNYKYQKNIQLTPLPDVKLCYEFYNPRGNSDKKLYIIHNSYGEQVLNFLQTNYKYMINRRYNWIGGKDFSAVPFVSDIEKYKPDTVLIIINSNMLGQILGLKLPE